MRIDHRRCCPQCGALLLPPPEWDPGRYPVHRYPLVDCAFIPEVYLSGWGDV